MGAKLTEEEQLVTFTHIPNEVINRCQLKQRNERLE